MDVSLSPNADYAEPTAEGSPAPLEPWQEANTLAADAIAAIAAEFDAEDESEVTLPPVTDTDDAPPLKAEAAAEEVAKPPEKEDPADRGTARLVEREVALRLQEEKLSARESAIAAQEARIAELESKAAGYEGDFHSHLRQRPTEALTAAGHDPEQIVRLYLAEKFSREGKPIPPKLQQEIERSEALQERAALRREMAQFQQQQASQAFVAGIEAGARTYITQGISKDAPTVAEVAVRQPDRVYREIMDEIARDAQSRSGKDANATVITYEEAAKRVEARWSEFRSLLSPPDASTKTATTTPAPSVATKGASSTALKAPAKPLSARKPVTQAELEAMSKAQGVAEFKRQATK